MLQIGAAITNWGNRFYKIGQVLQIGGKMYYKLGQLLQIRVTNIIVLMISETTVNGNIENVEIATQLKHLRKFWRTFQMPLVNCEKNPILT